MTTRISRRNFVSGAIAASSLPLPALAETKPIRIGLMTILTGPLAPAGIQMQQGTTLFLKDATYTMAGRKVELVVGDTGGGPAGAKTKAQELIERDHVDLIFGPLASYELLAISSYVAGKKVPILSLAAAGLYINGMVAEAALEKVGGDTDDKDALIRALRAVSLADSPRGLFHFDEFGNVVGNIFIRRCEKKDGKLVNTTVKTYPNVSQFWTYDEKWFLAQPVYSRDYPPLKS